MFQITDARPAETMLVHGASGGVGTAALQLGRAAGLVVIGTAGSEKGRNLVAEQGAHHVLDHGSPAHLEDLMKLTGGRGVDLILEMLANQNLAKDLGVLALKGRVVVVGNRGNIEINPRDAMSRDATIHGMTLFNVNDADMRSIHAALEAGLENRSLRPVIGRELPLAEAARAHEEVMKPGAYGKIVLEP
jgi:NADPH2:quinone reductase